MKKNKIFTIAAALFAGMALGWLLFHPGAAAVARLAAKHPQRKAAASAQDTVFTCAMHSWLRLHKPGNCPICGMKLIPLNASLQAAENNNTIQMSADAAALADVQTTIVKAAGTSSDGIYLTGKIMVDQRNIYTPTAQFDGRIERLYVNFTGQHVAKGQVLALVYSPDLISAEQELLVASSYKNTNPAMYQAARNKLKYWQIADGEIDKIEKSRQIIESLPIQANRTGVVMKMNVAVGDRVKTGDVLYQIADLNRLWVMMDAYEQNLGLISNGDRISFTVPAEPGKLYSARVSFIDPVIDPQTRIAKVRAEIDNPDGALKPEMFVRGKIEAKVGAPGGLLIPQSAVLWTGKQSLVYVKIPGTRQPTFQYRQVTLGPEAGDDYVITAGLSPGEEVVTNGAFTIDAAAQLAGKTSMMEPNGGGSGSMPGMNMNGDKTAAPMQKGGSPSSMPGMKM